MSDTEYSPGEPTDEETGEVPQEEQGDVKVWGQEGEPVEWHPPQPSGQVWDSGGKPVDVTQETEEEPADS